MMTSEPRSERKEATFNETYNKELWDALPKMVFSDPNRKQFFLERLESIPFELLYESNNDSGFESWFSRFITTISNSPYKKDHITQEDKNRYYQIIAQKFRELIQNITSPEQAIAVLSQLRDDKTLPRVDTDGQIKRHFMLHLMIFIDQKWPFQPELISSASEGKSSSEEAIPSSSLLIKTVLTWPMIESMPILFSSQETKTLLLNYLYSYANAITGERQYHTFPAKMNQCFTSLFSITQTRDSNAKRAAILENFLEIIDSMSQRGIALVGQDHAVLVTVLQKIVCLDLNGEHESPFFGQEDYFNIINQHFRCFMQAYDSGNALTKRAFDLALIKEFGKTSTLENPLEPELALKWLRAFSHIPNTLTSTDREAINSIVNYIFKVVLRQENSFIHAKKYLSSLYNCLHDNVTGISAMLIGISSAWKALPNERTKSTLLQEIAKDDNLCEFFAHCFARLENGKHINPDAPKNAYQMFAELRKIKIGDRQETNNAFYTKLIAFGQKGGNSGANVLNAVHRSRGLGFKTEAQNSETDREYVKPELDTLLILFRTPQPGMAVAIAAASSTDKSKYAEKSEEASFESVQCLVPDSLNSYSGASVLPQAQAVTAYPIHFAETVAPEEKRKVNKHAELERPPQPQYLEEFLPSAPPIPPDASASSFYSIGTTLGTTFFPSVPTHKPSAASPQVAERSETRGKATML